ncbi:Retrovirus-related Pol polyprotein from transposon TNT 1-94 [Senna tora]|uniref:Retrovirus-related Pol polyprotein from transposon TNT 1-94 n=1 Tax=Senna tora TaxID=362788 RepID=A0A834TFD7_9FABA|nr:Retrovirus-related Pol polyprotein from transposon TNT 1-94 [Senna tora]
MTCIGVEGFNPSAFGCLDLDYALCQEEPLVPMATSTPLEIPLYERWERSNRISLMLIKSSIRASIRGCIPDKEKVKDYIQAIDEQFANTGKSLTSTLMAQLSSMKYTGTKAKEKWPVNELLSVCVQEEGRLNFEKGEGSNEAHIVTNTKKQGHKGKNKKNELAPHSKKNKDAIKCFFCKKKGHGFLNQRKPSPGEQLVFPGNQIGSHVEAIRTYRVILNFIPLGFSLNINGFSFDLLKNGVSVGKFSLDNGLYKIHTNFNVASSLVTVHGNSGIKRSIMNEKSSMLWHKRLSIERIKSLEKDGILQSLDFSDLDSCVDCIKGWKPSLNHIRVWGYTVEVRVYNPHEKKLDPRTISAYFVGYAESSKRYKFYCPTHNLKFVESRNAKFLKNDTISGSDQLHELVNENDHEVIPTASGQGEIIFLIYSHPIEIIREHNVVSPVPSDHVERNCDIFEEAPHNAQEEPQEEFHTEQHQPPQEVELRRSQRAKKPAIYNDYMVYLLESDHDVNIEDDPVTDHVPHMGLMPQLSLLD